MKKLIAMLFAAFFAATLFSFSYAKEWKKEGRGIMTQESREKNDAKRLERMTKELNLSAEQKEKVSALMKEKSEKMLAERKKMADAHKAIMDDYDKKLKQVLTPEQAANHEKMMLEKKEKMEKKKGKKTERKKKAKNR